MYVLKNLGEIVPEGFEPISDEFIKQDFMSFDLDKDGFISKNEWLLVFIKMLASDVKALNNEGGDSLLGKIKQLSEEFDAHDLDGDKQISINEYKAYLATNVYIG